MVCLGELVACIETKNLKACPRAWWAPHGQARSLFLMMGRGLEQQFCANTLTLAGILLAGARPVPDDGAGPGAAI